MPQHDDFDKGLIWNSMDLPVPIDRFKYSIARSGIANLRREDIRFWITRHPSVDHDIFNEIIDKVQPVCIRFSSSKYTSSQALSEDVGYFATNHGKIDRCLDVSGPKVRISSLELPSSSSVADLPIRRGDRVWLSATATREHVATLHHSSVPLVYITSDIYARPNDIIMISDGWSQLKIIESKDNRYLLEALHNTVLSVHRGVDVPAMYENIDSTDSTVSYLAKNKACADLIDTVAISFVNHADVPNRVRKIFPEKRIVAKIETKQGLENLRQISEASDAIMFARGDLAVQMARFQEDMLEVENGARDLCLQMDKEFIIATRIADSLDNGEMKAHELYRLYKELSRALPVTLMLTNEISNPATAITNVDKLFDQIQSLKGQDGA